jgi:tricorn protease
MRYPAIHGDTVVFTYASDLWVANRAGGNARRLTSHASDEIRARISPDGTMVAFTGNYDGNNDVYVIPIEGGDPKRLTFDPNNDAVINWGPGGKILYASNSGSYNTRQNRLWMVDPKGGMPTTTKIEESNDGSFFADGHRFTYNRFNSHGFNWRRYRGGSQGVISIFDLANNSYSELPHKNENSWFPMAIGESIYYASDRNLGTVNLYRYDLASKKDTQLTQFNDEDIKWPSTDGKSIIFEHDGYLNTYDIATGKVDKLNFTVRSDFVSARPEVRKVDGQLSGAALNPAGTRVAVEAHGEIFTVPAKTGDTRNLTRSPGSRERLPMYSPDGKTLAYISDATGEYQIYTVPTAGGEATTLTNFAKGSIQGMGWSPDGKTISFTNTANELYLLDVATKKITNVFKPNYGGANDYDWSPDSKWIAYTDAAKTGFGRIYIYEVATGKANQVSEGYYDDANVTFDQSGKYLYFVSSRTFNPQGGKFELSLRVTDTDRIYVMPLSKDLPDPLNPMGEDEDSKRGGGQGQEIGGAPVPVNVKIDFAGLSDRTLVLPLPAGSYQGLDGSNEGVFFSSGGNLMRFDMRARAPMTIMAGVGRVAFNASKTKFVYLRGGRDTLVGISDVRPDSQVGVGRVDLSGLQTVVDPRAEWKEMFWDAWRFERDHFYDPQMTGLDWKGIGDHYARYLPYVNHRSDLNYVLGLLIGELGTSHAYVQPSPPDPDAGTPPPSASLLGADYEVVGNNVRFKKVYKGSSFEEGRRGPLNAPGVNVSDGDYLLEIDGLPVNAMTNPGSLLIGKAGQIVVLTINSTASMTGARKVRVRPVANEADIRYVDWVEATRKRVAELSGGRIGYIHYPNTSQPGQIEFIRGFYGQTDKDALIMDERWNGGGFVQPMVVPTLARMSETITMARNNPMGSPELAAMNGPKAMLINGYSGSGGDFTPWMFRDMKVGPLIGTRTWGGLVGIQGYYNLMDGGGVSAPSFAFYDVRNGEWVAENKGVSPDIPVDMRPDLVAAGHDPQLEEAVKYLLQELKKQKKPVDRPNYPVAKPGVGGG